MTIIWHTPQDKRKYDCEDYIYIYLSPIWHKGYISIKNDFGYNTKTLSMGKLNKQYCCTQSTISIDTAEPTVILSIKVFYILKYH